MTRSTHTHTHNTLLPPQANLQKQVLEQQKKARRLHVGNLPADVSPLQYIIYIYIYIYIYVLVRPCSIYYIYT